MKKTKLVALGLALATFLTACGGQKGTTQPAESGATSGAASEQVTTASTEMTVPTPYALRSLDYVTTAFASDNEVYANLVDGLLENDSYGHLVGALAEKWEHNDDFSEWTFHIRKGAKWVTSTGEEWPTPVTAEDFVTGVRHGAEFESGTSWLLQDTIDGYSAYLQSDFSDAEWEKVGIKATDENTLVITMQKDESGKPRSVPYFDSMTTYGVLYPINKEFLEGQGAGCKLGQPNKEDCTFGAVRPDAILYNGAYILASHDEKSQTVLTKNASYWDAEHVYLEKVTRVYDDQSDPYSIKNGYESGIYPTFSLNPSWKDYDTVAKSYDGKTNYTVPNASVFGVVFNYNRQSFKQTNYATDTTLAENTHKAILNLNFRKALRAAFDMQSYLATRSPKDLATKTLRNINNFPGAGTTSDGKTYFDLVTEAYQTRTGEDRDLHDEQMAFYSKEDAMKYIEAAKAEGIQFPIHLDMLTISTNDALVKQAQSMKKSIEENTEGNIIIEIILRDEDTVQNIAYYNQDPAGSDYDISTFTGWSPDYADPRSFVDIYSPTAGYYMTSMGLGTMSDDGTVADLDIKQQLGFMEYEDLYRKADAIGNDLDARYKAFAEADAYLIEKALFIPTSQQTRGNRVSKIVPFTSPYADYGNSSNKYKGYRLQENPVTVEQYQKAYEEFLKKSAEK
ncbi:MAG: ABC transporter substrate-binding protein [Peptoniphilaceae bacterium]|nr:ABC transporter substrate-binding protein [Peptoniphilaceae bacterium]